MNQITKTYTITKESKDAEWAIKLAKKEYDQAWQMFHMGYQVMVTIAGLWEITRVKDGDVWLESRHTIRVIDFGRKYLTVDLGEELGGIKGVAPVQNGTVPPRWAPRIILTVKEQEPRADNTVTIDAMVSEASASYQERCRRTGRGNHFDNIS